MKHIDTVKIYEKEDGGYVAKSETFLVEAEGAEVPSVLYDLSGKLREFAKHSFDAIKDVAEDQI